MAFHQTLWVAHEELAFARAELIEGNLGKGKKIKVRLEDNGEVLEVLSDEVQITTLDEAKEHKITDLTKLPDLNHAALLQTLSARFEHDEIYTFTGKILIAVNPFKAIKGLYSKKTLDQFVNLNISQANEMPHVFGIAHQSYMAMLERKGRNQSILVSGESGAGKTETTKKVMMYLTEISKLKSQGTGSEEICDRVLQTNPLLEAFGNAKTVRNDNSSRFGKLIQMQFNPDNKDLIGAFIDTYLLEKGRIIHQAKRERNYHIFYELAAGLSSSQKKEWHMLDPSDSSYTNQSGTFKRNDIGDKEQFKQTLKAMDIVGVDQAERDRVFRTVIAVMHLGNIRFDETMEDSEEGSKIAGATMRHAEACCDLLKTQVQDLEGALTSRSLSVGGMSFVQRVAGGEGIKKKHTVEQANEARDALAMAIYERLFLWLVWRVNSSISETQDSTKKRLSMKLGRKGKKGKGKGKGKAEEIEYTNDFSIGCLDIFGFEVFEINSFEQLCINYANEVLQQQFNEYVFTLEQELYKREGIDWENIKFPNNIDCIHLIENTKRPIGLLKLVDEECMYPQGSDATLYKKLMNNLEPNFDRFTVDPLSQKAGMLFSIRHFAGDVEYDTHGFYAKNKNELRVEAVNFCRSSADELVKILIHAGAALGKPAPLDYFDSVSAATKKRRKSKLRGSFERRMGDDKQKIQQTTVGTQFKEQLHLALRHIKQSEPQYIRCVKPNDKNVKEEFDRVRVLEQLNYSGVLEVVRVARAGYFSRFSVKEFNERFHCLSSEKAKSRKRADQLVAVHRILEASSLKKVEDFQIGFTIVFLRSDAYTRLERMKNFILVNHTIKLQRFVRNFLAFNRTRIELRRKEREMKKKKEAEEKAQRERERKAEEERQRQLEAQQKREMEIRLALEREAAEKERLRKIKEEEERLQAEIDRKERERKQREAEEAERKRIEKLKQDAAKREAAAKLLRKQNAAATVVQSFARMIIAKKQLRDLEAARDAAQYRQKLLEQQKKLYAGGLGATFVDDDSDVDDESGEEDDSEDEDDEEEDLESLYITAAAVSACLFLLFPRVVMYLLFSAACVGGGGLLAIEYQKFQLSNRRNIDAYYGNPKARPRPGPNHIVAPIRGDRSLVSTRKGKKKRPKSVRSVRSMRGRKG